MREVKVKAWAPERFYKWRGTVVVVIISAQSPEKIFWCPPLFSCAHPVFDGIRGTTIS